MTSKSVLAPLHGMATWVIIVLHRIHHNGLVWGNGTCKGV